MVSNTGTLVISGSATDDKGVARVDVGVRMNGKWWNAATRTWVPAFTPNPAKLAGPGKPSTTWTFSVPVPAAGGPVVAQADAVDTDGQTDPQPRLVPFTVASLGNPPDTTITTPSFTQVFFFPNGRNSFPITISGTASDTLGAHPGVKKLLLTVLNIEHAEYYCGPAGCPGLPGVFWRAKYIAFRRRWPGPTRPSRTGRRRSRPTTTRTSTGSRPGPPTWTGRPTPARRRCSGSACAIRAICRPASERSRA